MFVIQVITFSFSNIDNMRAGVTFLDDGQKGLTGQSVLHSNLQQLQSLHRIYF